MSDSPTLTDQIAALRQRLAAKQPGLIDRIERSPRSRRRQKGGCSTRLKSRSKGIGTGAVGLTVLLQSQFQRVTYSSAPQAWSRSESSCPESFGRKTLGSARMRSNRPNRAYPEESLGCRLRCSWASPQTTLCTRPRTICDALAFLVMRGFSNHRSSGHSACHFGFPANTKQGSCRQEANWTRSFSARVAVETPT
jgi:hypothetical protein